MNTASLLIVLAVEDEARWHTRSETRRKRFDAIEKEKLDMQLEETDAMSAAPPQENTVEMETEQFEENQGKGGASSSCGPAIAVQEAVPMPSSRSQEVRMEVTEPSSSTRPLEEGDKTRVSKRVRSRAGMLLFDENDTSNWQNSIQE